MMHGHEKSRSAVVAVKPTNKAERSAAEPVERRAETEGNAGQQSTHRAQYRVRVAQALACIRRVVAVDTRGGNRMRESCTYGSVRGAPSNGRPYRDRRQFITLLGGAAATWPLAARAQGTERSRVIGVLMTSFPEVDPEGQARIAAFLTTFQKLGWVDGRNCRIVVRWAAGDLGRMHRFAKELIALHPDVVVVMATPALTAMQRITRTVPIVFVQISDPVGAGFVANIAHPGGNMTGFANFEEAMGGKWLDLLMEVAPHLTRVTVLIAGTAVNHALWKNAQAAAASIRVSLIAAEVHDSSGVEPAIAAFAADGKGGLIVLPDPIFNTLRDSIVEWATRHQLPAIYPFPFYARKGGLLSYGIDQIAQFRGAAQYVDRILRGEKPGDLPVQAPTKYELVINLKTAKALGLEVPPTLLARADEVIE